MDTIGSSAGPPVHLRTLAMRRFLLSDGRQIAVRCDGGISTIDSESAKALALCQRFARARTHATELYLESKFGAFIALSNRNRGFRATVGRAVDALRESIHQNSLPDDQIGTELAMIERLVNCGLLEDESSATSRYCSDVTHLPDPGVRIGTVAIPTKDRPELLGRTLRSYLSAQPNVCDFVVIDSSRGATARSVAELCGIAAAQHRVRVRYAGVRRRLRFGEALAAKSGIPREIVDFAMFGEPELGITTGASRNCILLDAAGEGVLQVDDDTQGVFAPALERDATLRITSHVHPVEDYFDHVHFRRVRTEEMSFTKIHEQALGRNATAMVRQAASANCLDIGHANHAMAAVLAQGVARVAGTICGYMGDCAQHSTIGYLLLDGTSWERLTASPTVYRRAMLGRQIMRASRGISISDAPSCMSVNMGLDHTELLPPFFPLFRNQDGVFAATMRNVSSFDLLAHLPWMVQHDPASRQYSSWEDIWKNGVSFRFSDFLIAFVDSFPRNESGTARAIAQRRLSEYLASVGRLSLKAFADMSRTLLVSKAAARLRWLEGRNSVGSWRRPFWADDVDRYRQNLLHSMSTPGAWLPSDLLPGHDEQAVLEHMQRLTARFGELLGCWAALVEGAKSLKDQGVRMND